MKRVLKIVGIIIAALCGLLGILILTVNLIPGDIYKSWISKAVRSSTGREMVIEGGFGLRLTSSFEVNASGVKLANATWGSRPHMATIDHVETKVALFPFLRGILDITVIMDRPDVVLETRPSGESNWEFGQTKGSPPKPEENEEAPPNGGLLPIEPLIRKLQINQARIAFIDGRQQKEYILVSEGLHIETEDTRLEVDLKAKFNGVPLALTGGFENAAALVNKKPTKVKFDGHFGEAHLNAQGTASPKGAGLDLDLQVETGIPSVAFLGPVLQMELPDLGPISASFNVVIDDGQPSIDDILVDAQGESLHLRTTGAVADLAALNGVRLELIAEANSLAVIENLIDMQLPPMAPLHAVVSMVSSENSSGAVDINASLSGNSLKANLAGAIDSLFTFEAVNAIIDLDVSSLEFLSDYLETDLSPLGQLKASVDISSKGHQFKVNAMQAQLDGKGIKAEATGEIKELLKLAGITADLRLNLNSVNILNPMAKKELPDSGPIALQTTITSKSGPQGATGIVSLVSGDGFEFNLEGSIADVLEARGIDMQFWLHADSFEKLGKLVGKSLQYDDPLELKGRFTSDVKTFRLADMNLKSGELKIQGETTLTLPEHPHGRPHIGARLDVGNLDTRRKPSEATKEQVPPEPSSPESTSSKKKIFPSDPLPLDMLKSMDMDFELAIDSLTTRQFDLKDIEAGLTLNNGILTLIPNPSQPGRGPLIGKVVLDASKTEATLTAVLEFSGATLRDFGGKVHCFVDLDGRGNSIAELMAGLNGRLEFDLHGTKVKSSYISGFGSDLLNTLNPFSKDQETTEIICAVVLFDIENGKADGYRKMVAQMPDVTWFGGGEIDLKTEEINFGVHPQARKGLGIGAGGLAKLVHVGGTLAQPKIELNPKDFAVKYGKFMAAVATGGITLAADLVWGKMKANEEVCGEVLKLIEADKPSESN